MDYTGPKLILFDENNQCATSFKGSIESEDLSLIPTTLDCHQHNKYGSTDHWRIGKCENKKFTNTELT
jgi:hypothetical protein